MKKCKLLNFPYSGKNRNIFRAMKLMLIILVICFMHVPSTVFAIQQSTVSGKVSDSRNQPLPGVTVIIKGTTQGTVTDTEGSYSINNVSSNSTLVFSFVGMQAQEIVVGNQTTINVTLEEETIGLEEVVAIGYGTQRKETLTGSVTGTTNDEIIRAPVIGVSNAIARLLPGVVVTNR
ncbi:MAG: carboxypeptidase-like regulatory domain-containing protein, partial [Prolixibacteraceae bacterium]|nr:carboxypeptidase-like regulatory domain-containing protein [Prolixibacteraceae bacterium]